MSAEAPLSFDTPDHGDPDILAFAGHRLLVRGARSHVAQQVHASAAHRDGELVLLFHAATGRQLDLDLSGDSDDVARRYPADVLKAGADSGPAEDKPRRGRPRLGVVGREITLLPRHWAWLETQRGGASATLRRLVDEARRGAAAGDRVRAAQDRGQRFMSALAGDLSGFEEATRALYASDRDRFEQEIAAWPADLRRIVGAMTAEAFGAGNVVADSAAPPV